MRYLFEQGRFKLYEVESQDKQLTGTTGNQYDQDTVLIFETVESEVEIGREVAWAQNERDAMDLADDITAGVQNIPIDVQMNLAGKIVEDKQQLAKEARKKGQRGQAQAVGQPHEANKESVVDDNQDA